MNRNIKNNIVVCIALSLGFAVGCGDLPEDEVANLYVGQETGAQTQMRPQSVYAIPDVSERPTVDRITEELVDLEPIPEEGFDFEPVDVEIEDPLADGFADHLDIPVNTESDADSIEDGFSDGDGSEQEWKGLAKGICRRAGAEVEALEYLNAAGEGLYRASRFVCLEDDVDSEEPVEAKFTAVVFGSEATCKTYAALESYAINVCGTTSEIVEKQVFEPCADSDGQTMYRSAVFVCMTSQR